MGKKKKKRSQEANHNRKGTSCNRHNPTHTADNRTDYHAD